MNVVSVLLCRKSGWDIDCVVPVPDGSRPAAIQMSADLGLPYREGLVKNRYVGRTFIMPDQRTRELSVRRKLNAMPAVFSGKSVLLVDDSIVRGTTMSQIVDMVRKAGAKKVIIYPKPHVHMVLWVCQTFLHPRVTKTSQHFKEFLLLLTVCYFQLQYVFMRCPLTSLYNTLKC